MDHIVLQSAGSLSVAVLSFIMVILQILLLVRKPQITWFGWSAGVSFSGMLYAIGIFYEYNTAAGALNRAAGLLEFTAIIFLIHSAYGFTFSILGRRGRRYHQVAGCLHAVILVLLWSTELIVADQFVSRHFLWLSAPYVEPALGPLGPVFEGYGVASCLGIIFLCCRSGQLERPRQSIILTGILFWLALAVHDGLASLGVPTVQYLMEYGFLGFSMGVLWVVFTGFEDMAALERIRTVADFANDIILMIQGGRVVFANPAAVNLLGWFGGQPTIEDFVDLVAPDDRQRFLEHYLSLLNNSAASEFLIVRATRPSGEDIVVEIRAKRVVYKATTAILAAVRDTTQRIREEEGNFVTFFESMEDMVMVASSDGRVMHANSAVGQRLGYAAHETVGMYLSDFFSESRRSDIDAGLDAIGQGERSVWHLPLRTRSGAVIPAEFRIWPARWSGAECVFGMAKDLTAEQEAKDLLNQMFSNNPALMALFSMPERRLIEANRSFLSTLGYAIGDIAGKTTAELDLFADPAMETALLREGAATGHVFNRELQVKRKDGAMFDCLLSAEIIHHSGRRLLLAVMIDISGRRQAERQLLAIHASLEERVRERTRAIEDMHTQMMMQEKLASIGQMAAGVAHELNNPINFLVANFASLKENFTDLFKAIRGYRKHAGPSQDAGAAELREMEKDLQVDFILKDTPVLFEESQRGFDRIDRIIRSMRQFSHMDHKGRFAPFNINKAVENAVLIARNTYKHCARVVVEPGQVPDIACLPEQLHQVLLNLIVNGAQAIESQSRKEPGRITVRTYAADEQVVCEVADDGPGIEEDIRDRIFEAFFTTKPPGKGSGLGLSLSYDIVVNKHGGALDVACPAAGGTVFTIRLPVSQKNASADAAHR